MSSLTITYNLQKTKFVLINWLKVVQYDGLKVMIYHATSHLSFIIGTNNSKKVTLLTLI